MTIVVPEFDLEFLLFAEEEFPKECNLTTRSKEDCTIPAKWWVAMKLKCCDQNVFLCDSHKDLIISEFDIYRTITCRIHNREHYKCWNQVIRGSFERI